MDQETRNWAMLLHLSILLGTAFPSSAAVMSVSAGVLHLSIFLGTAFPVIGMIVPVVIWQWKRQTLPMIDPHGRMAVNFIISMIVYWLAVGAVGLVTYGMFGLIYVPIIVLGIVGVVFPLIAAMKANQGIFWRYPYIYNWIR